MQQLTTQQEVDAVLGEDVAVLYKHSAYCPISAAAYQEVQRFEQRHADAPVYLIDVNVHRDVSRYVADRTAITHHSPQAIVLQGGEPRWHASHYDVTAEALQRQIETLKP